MSVELAKINHESTHIIFYLQFIKVAKNMEIWIKFEKVKQGILLKLQYLTEF